jgi:SAM-dependent methyltransferase
MVEQPWDIGRLMATSGSYWHACALHAGVKLEIFTHIGRDALNAATLAKRVPADLRGIEILLNALTAMHLLEKSEGRFKNSAFAQTALVKTSPQYVGYMIKHHHYLVESWARLDQAVLSGEPVRESAVSGDDDRRESFLMGMFNTAMGSAPQVAESIDLDGRHRLLDLGGGPGTYAIHFCKANAQLQAVVYDLPTTRPFAKKIVQKFGMSDRIEFVGGDFLTDLLPGSYDAIWISHILHAQSPDECRALIQKAAAALEPGGLMIVHDFILENTMDGPLFPALFALNMLAGTPSGQSYSEAQIIDMLSGAGIEATQRLPFCGPTESGIITGIKSKAT